MAQEGGVRYKNEMDTFHKAKRTRNERQAVYLVPGELPSSMTGNSVHDFGNVLVSGRGHRKTDLCHTMYQCTLDFRNSRIP